MPLIEVPRRPSDVAHDCVLHGVTALDVELQVIISGQLTASHRNNGASMVAEQATVHAGTILLDVPLNLLGDLCAKPHCS